MPLTTTSNMLKPIAYRVGVALARPRLRRFNRLLLRLSLQGLGIYNYKTPKDTGEARLLLEVATAFAGQPWTALDVGANLGSYSQALLAASPSVAVIGFEPHPNCVNELRGLESARFTVVEGAVGRRSNEIVYLYDYGTGTDGSEHASLHEGVVETFHGRPSQRREVRTISLDDWWNGHEPPRPPIGFLKVDTEGHELEVLAGATELLRDSAVQAVQLEFNEMNIISHVFLRDIAATLSEFDLYRLLPKGLLPLAVEPLDEVFAFQNVLALRRGSLLESRLRASSYLRPAR